MACCCGSMTGSVCPDHPEYANGWSPEAKAQIARSEEAAKTPPVRQLSQYPSLHIARRAVEAEFEGHETGKTKKGKITDAILLKRYKAKRAEMMTVAQELAKLETDLKRRIGFDSAMEVPNEGTLFWTSQQISGRSVSKVNWMALVRDLQIPEETVKKYRQRENARRRFFLKRGVKGPEGIEHLAAPAKSDVELDDDF